MEIDPGILDWLLEGDPNIRWQVMRVLLDQLESVWRRQQERIPSEGWGAEFLRHQRPDGTWPPGC